MSYSIPNVIRSQISANTYLCIGSMGPVSTAADSDRSLLIRIRLDNMRRFIRVTLNGKDLYDLEQILDRRGERKTVLVANDIYCDQLDEMVYRMGSTRHMSEQALNDWGISLV